MLNPDPWFDNFAAKATGAKADSTISTHLSHAKCLREKFFNGATCCKIICYGQEAPQTLVDLALMEEVAEGVIKKSTLAGYVEALLAIVGVMAPAEFRNTLAKEHLKAWKDAYRAIQNSVVEPRNQGIPTKRQLAGYTPLQRLIAGRDALVLHSRERLFLEVYTRLPPLRLDYAAVKIFWLNPAEGEVDLQGWAGNYLVLDPAKQNSYLHVVEPKKGHNRPAYAAGIKAAVPEMLQVTLEASLQDHPRDFLFTTMKGGKPSNKPFNAQKSSCFSTFANRVLKEVLDNAAVNMHILRNIYTIALYKAYAEALNGSKGEEAQQFAKVQISKCAFLMAHSVDEHARYYFRTDSGPDPEEFRRLTALKLPVLGVEARKQPLAIVDFTSALEAHVE